MKRITIALSDVKIRDGSQELSPEKAAKLKKEYERYWEDDTIPILLDRDGYLLSGFSRYRAAIKCGMKTIDAVIDLPPVEEYRSDVF